MKMFIKVSDKIPASPKKHFLFSAALALSMLLAAGPASAEPDVFSTEKLTASTQAGSSEKPLMTGPCGGAFAENAVLSLADVVERALCNNPQTRIAWVTARTQAAQVGVAKSAYLPSVTINGTANQTQLSTGSLTSGGNTSYNQEDISATLSYLLYDFGQRSSTLDSALQTLYSLNATQDATLQSVFLSAAQGYYQLLAANALVDSSREAERSALESYNAATAKYKVGAATPSDKLQAKTAHSQAVLTRIQAEGTAINTKGVLANAMGIEPTRNFSISRPPVPDLDYKFEKNIERLIEDARAQRPDLAAAQAQVKAAEANVEAAKASGMPSLSLSGSYNYSTSSLMTQPTNNTMAGGLSLTIPLFTGYGTTYRIRSAQEQTALRVAQQEQVSQQVALDVWQAYQNFVTGTQSVKSSEDLVASATESEKVTLGRYKAGMGNILDVLTAQSALASARQQYIQALFNWYINKATLARSVGRLDFSAIEPAKTGKMPPQNNPAGMKK